MKHSHCKNVKPKNTVPWFPPSINMILKVSCFLGIVVTIIAIIYFVTIMNVGISFNAYDLTDTHSKDDDHHNAENQPCRKFSNYRQRNRVGPPPSTIPTDLVSESPSSMPTIPQPQSQRLSMHQVYPLFHPGLRPCHRFLRVEMLTLDSAPTPTVVLGIPSEAPALSGNVSDAPTVTGTESSQPSRMPCQMPSFAPVVGNETSAPTTTAASSMPSEVPTLSGNFSGAPSVFDTESSHPSSELTLAPTVSHAPSQSLVPTSSPTISISPSLKLSSYYPAAAPTLSVVPTQSTVPTAFPTTTFILWNSLWRGGLFHCYHCE